MKKIFLIVFCLSIIVLINSCSDDEPDFFDVTYTLIDITCMQPGKIDVTVTGGTPPYKFLWSNDRTTEDLITRAQGIYNLIVTDNEGRSKIVNNIKLNKVLRVEIEGIVNNSDVYSDTGSIELKIERGIPPYRFEWSNSQTTQNISDLPPGRYSVDVFDSSDCNKVSAEFVINAFGEFTDNRDGKIYRKVRNGNQVWMYEPLNYATADGSSFMYDDPANEDIGRYYTWHTAMNGESLSTTNPSNVRGLCPEGWHIPSPDEWTELRLFLETQMDDDNKIDMDRHLEGQTGVTFMMYIFTDLFPYWRDEGITTFITSNNDVAGAYSYYYTEGDYRIGFSTRLTTEYPSQWQNFKHLCYCIEDK